ncbi:Putative N-methyltransferase domain and SET domain containing protein [Klebsormidium nitens]|uniref:Putative N-methyltransferase domain and SET domain containing protein n=1 Tax=Klebsormidium nitens TaxID=105231 RepID=A0A1Y1HW46_KLENI|nr:Putative N-methyltransferase domain and SET domain containing protein [Klebsormidium nitens]|eukprot:GAQ82874.1 Putative N-methyltransferase domain and SET domain containing protein [Klebsormidium nitens]
MQSLGNSGMLTVQLALRADDKLRDRKEALLNERKLSMAVNLASSSPDSSTAFVEKLLCAERILQLNEDELYFVEDGSTGPYSPRNELEALYHLHQLLTPSQNPITNQSLEPGTSSNDELSTPISQQSTSPSSQMLQSLENQDSNTGIREAAKDEVVRRLMAYGGDKPVEAGERCTGSAEQELLTWAERNGVVSNVEPAVFPSTGRGAVATADVAVGETVLEVPETMIISPLTAMESDMADAFSRVPDLDEDTAALLWSMRERHVSSSRWAPFFRSLPEAFHTGLSFSTATIDELEDTPAFEGLLAAQQHLRSQYAALFPALTNAFPTVLPASSFTWDEFLWASELWYSYGIKVQFSDGRVRTALVPLVCLLNHAVSPHVTHFSRVDPQTRTLRLPAARPCPAGAQCFLSYGPLQSTDLLTFYGFTVDDNPYDAIQMDLELPEDDLLPAKQALLTARGLGLPLFVTAAGVPSRLYGALRVLLMDEQELEVFKGDPRREKISDANELAMGATFLGTIDALLALGQRLREANLNGDTDEMEGNDCRESKGGIRGIGGQTENVPPSEEGSHERGLRDDEEGTVAVAKRYRERQNRLLLRIRRSFVAWFEAAE